MWRNMKPTEVWLMKLQPGCAQIHPEYLRLFGLLVRLQVKSNCRSFKQTYGQKRLNGFYVWKQKRLKLKYKNLNNGIFCNRSPLCVRTSAAASASAPPPSSAPPATSEPSAERRPLALHAGNLVVVVAPLPLVLLTVPICRTNQAHQWWPLTSRGHQSQLRSGWPLRSFRALGASRGCSFCRLLLRDAERSRGPSGFTSIIRGSHFCLFPVGETRLVSN